MNKFKTVAMEFVTADDLKGLPMPAPLRLVKPNEARTKLVAVPETIELLRNIKVCCELL